MIKQGRQYLFPQCKIFIRNNTGSIKHTAMNSASSMVFGLRLECCFVLYGCSFYNLFIKRLIK